MTKIGRQSRKEELWRELERLQAEREAERNRAAVVRAEVERLRAENARLAEQAEFTSESAGRLQEANERLEILNSLTKELASFDLDGVLEVCVKRIPYLVGAGCASVYLHDPARRRLLLKHHTHGREIDPVVSLDEAPGSLMALAVREQRVLCIDDLGRFRAGRGEVERPHSDRYRTASCVVAPLVAGGEVQGVLNLADRFDERPFDPERELVVVRQACDLVAVSIRNARLFEEVQQAARTDSLTGVLDRQAFLATVEIEIKRALRYENDLAVVLVKLDGLRLVNANFGHQAGDAVLTQAAEVLRGNVRDVDVVGRAGGSTFGLILPEQQESGALTVAHRVAGILAETEFQAAGAAHRLERALGVAVYPRGGDASDLVDRALAAIDAARGQGASVGVAPPPEGGADEDA